MILPLEKHSKILGVFFDPSVNFAEHCKRTSATAAFNTSILMTLSGTSSGQSKETLRVTFKALVRPILDHVSPAWSHFASITTLNKPQTVTDIALSVITRCSKMSATKHLHSECKLFNVDHDHHLLAPQFALKSSVEQNLLLF